MADRTLSAYTGWSSAAAFWRPQNFIHNPYNPPREPARQQQWRIHTSNIILAARDFSLPLSKAEVRKPLHVPLQLVPACSIHHSLAGTPSRSVSELLGPGMVPITTRNAD